MVPETNDLERELQRNLKLRRELGGEIRLGLLMTKAAADNGDVPYRPEARDAETTLPNRVLGIAWIALGAIGLALAAFIAVWLT